MWGGLGDLFIIGVFIFKISCIIISSSSSYNKLL